VADSQLAKVDFPLPGLPKIIILFEVLIIPHIYFVRLAACAYLVFYASYVFF
jgi:hypothetical protein